MNNSPKEAIKELSNIRTELSMEMIKKQEIKSIPLKPNQKPLKIVLNTSNQQDYKILYESEWYSFDLILTLLKKEVPRQRSKSPV